MKKPLASSEASPYKSVADELEALRKTFRSLAHRYTARVEAEINGLRDAVLTAASGGTDHDAGPRDEVPATGPASTMARTRARKNTVASERQATQIHDLRDMLTLLRTFEISSEVAKRRDFKLVENVLEELRELTRRWD